MLSSKPETSLTISPDQFSIDSMPTTVEERIFDKEDNDLPEIVFVSPDTGAETNERSALVTNFCFNGTALLTPSAFDGEHRDLTLDAVDRSKLNGPLLILDIEKGIEYGREEIRKLVEAQGIDLEVERSIPEYIVLFRTKLMNEVLKTADKNGCPDYDELDEVQKNRPGITRIGAQFLRETNLAKSIMIDNISFETTDAKGYFATQELAAPNQINGTFTPLIYNVGNTEGDDFVEKHQGKNARIEIGNPPQKGLTGYPVGVYVE